MYNHLKSHTSLYFSAQKMLLPVLKKIIFYTDIAQTRRQLFKKFYGVTKSGTYLNDWLKCENAFLMCVIFMQI